MSTPTESTGNIDEKIEKRIALLRDSIELKLTKEVDALLKTRFESTGKILGWAFGLVAVVFAGFGIKTLFDVKEVARTTAIEEVKKKLSIDDPNSEFRRDIDKVVARGLIDSYLLTIAKTKGERFRSDFSISESDFRRLQSLVTDSKTSDKDFSDAVEVLLKSSARGRDDSLDRLIKALGSGSEEKYRWIGDQPEKKAALLRIYTGDKLTQVSSAVLSDEKSSKSLMLAAIKYSGSKDQQSGKQLERLAAHRDTDIAHEAAVALARVEPTSPTVRAVLHKPQKTNDPDDWAKALRVAIELARPSGDGLFRNDPNEEQRTSLAAETLQNAVNENIVFRLSSNRNFDGESTAALLYVSSRKEYSRLYGISTSVIRGASQSVITPLFRRASKNSGQLLALTRAFCLEDDGRCWGLVRTGLERGGTIVLQGQSEITSAMAPGGATIRPEDSKVDSPIVVTWTDTNAVSKRGILVGLKNAEQMSFSVRTTKSVSRGDEDE